MTREQCTKSGEILYAVIHNTISIEFFSHLNNADKLANDIQSSGFQRRSHVGQLFQDVTNTRA